MKIFISDLPGNLLLVHLPLCCCFHLPSLQVSLVISSFQRYMAKINNPNYSTLQLLTQTSKTNRIATLTIPQFRAVLLSIKARASRTAKDENIEHALKKCDVGDWFVLYQIGRNVNPRFFREFLERLGGSNKSNKREDNHNDEMKARDSGVDSNNGQNCSAVVEFGN